jgi:hypothetical protein
MRRPAGKNQKAALLSLGNATSCTPSWVGNKKFPNAPNNKGIIIKKTIITACAVTTLRYCKLSPARIPTPGYAISSLIIVASTIPKIPDIMTKK